LLIAQSQVEKMTLATVDGAFVGVASALPNRDEIDSLSEQLSRHKCRLMGERNFVWVRPNFSLQPNLQILALSQLWLEFLRSRRTGGAPPLQIKETLKRR
jgi:hypothetical protein